MTLAPDVACVRSERSRPIPTTTTFDSLGYFEKLTNVGFTEAQARVQVSAMQDFVSSYDEAHRKELATKGDVREAELRVQKEIETVRKDIEKVRYDMLRWYIGGWVAMAVMIAKGFGWFGL